MAKASKNPNLDHTVKDSTGKAKVTKRDTSKESEEFVEGREQASPLRVQDTRPGAEEDHRLRPLTMHVLRSTDKKGTGAVVINREDFNPDEHTPCDADGKALSEKESGAAARKASTSRRVRMADDADEAGKEGDDSDDDKPTTKRARVSVKDDEDEDDDADEADDVDTKKPETGKAQGSDKE